MQPELWDRWVQNWEWAMSCMKRKGCRTKEVVVTEPISLWELEGLQEKLDIILPGDYVRVVTGFAQSLTLFWHLDDPNPPKPYHQVFSSWADALWDVRRLTEYKTEYENWLRESFIDPDDPYDKVWYDKLAFMTVPNSDMIAFDVTAGHSDCPVVYLSHDDGELHGCRLGTSFVDFMSRWSNLGCPGPEDWQMAPFYDWERRILMDSGEVVENWKRWINE